MLRSFKYILIITSIIISFNSYSQKCKFLKKSHDYEEVISTVVPAAAFPFVNTGDKPLAIINVRSSYETKTQYERKYIQPKDTGYIYVKYESPRLGNFSETITVFTNASPDPATLTIKGKNISVVDCFPNKSNKNIRLVQVIDKVTKEAIEGAELTFNNINGQRISAKSGKLGKVTEEIPISQYEITITKKGYRPLRTNLYINKSKPIIFFELEPLKTKQPRQEPNKEPKEETIVATNSEENELVAQYTGTDGLGNKYAANNITFLIDVSLSMKQYNRIENLKLSISELINELRHVDYVTIIVYNNATKTIVSSVQGSNKDSLLHAVNSLTPKGLTNGVKGLQSAYQFAEKNFIKGGNNQIILATDGEFTGKGQSERDIKSLIRSYNSKGIKMSIIDFGKEKESSERLARIAEFSGGSYLFYNPSKPDNSLIITEIKKQSYIK